MKIDFAVGIHGAGGRGTLLILAFLDIAAGSADSQVRVEALENPAAFRAPSSSSWHVWESSVTGLTGCFV